jgi:hypothetical protein
MCVLGFVRLESVVRYAEKMSAKAVLRTDTRTITQMARPIRSFLTYGERKVSVRKGVVWIGERK